MKKNFVLSSYLLLLLALPLRAQLPDSLPHLGDSAYAALLTCGAGDEFYTSFGHSALRICDSTQGIDYVYNYGTFDFDIPHFYWQFARGYLNYHLSRSPFNGFLFEYQYEGRAIWQQRLRLTNQEVNNLFLLLETNHLPEYRYYQYDFFRDNCATRPRDMIAHSLDHRTLAPETTTDTNLTYRNLLYRSTAHTLLWWRLAVDMALGLPCDHRCSNYEYMFSPIEMMHQFDTLTVSDTRQPLADPATLILPETRTPPPAASHPPSPSGSSSSPCCSSPSWGGKTAGGSAGSTSPSSSSPSSARCSSSSSGSSPHTTAPRSTSTSSGPRPSSSTSSSGLIGANPGSSSYSSSCSLPPAS